LDLGKFGWFGRIRFGQNQNLVFPKSFDFMAVSMVLTFTECEDKTLASQPVRLLASQQRLGGQNQNPGGRALQQKTKSSYQVRITSNSS